MTKLHGSCVAEVAPYQLLCQTLEISCFKGLLTEIKQISKFIFFIVGKLFVTSQD